MKPPVPVDEAKRLDALRRYQILDTAPEQLFDDVARLASAITQSPIALMTLIDAERQWIKARVGADIVETPREHAFCAYTILGNTPLVVENATTDRRFSENPFVTGDAHIRFYAGTPLIDADGNALGSLCVVDREPRTITPAQLDALAALGRTVIALLAYRRVSAQLAESLEDAKTLRGLLPICCNCKRIRNDKGYWQRVDVYLANHTQADFSHGICPKCIKALYPDYAQKAEPPTSRPAP